jgi:O-antigen/teichoic acid export membrane protein
LAHKTRERSNSVTSVTSSPEICEPRKGETRIHSRLAKGASIYTLGTVLGKLLMLAIQVLLARLLRISGYGLYNLGFNAVILLQSLALMGLDQGVLRYGAVYRTRGEIESVKGTLLASLVLGFVSSLLVAAALFLASPAVATRMFREPKLAPTLHVFAVVLPFYVVARVTSAFAQSHHDILRMTLIQQIAQPGVNLVLVAALFFLRGGLQSAVYAFVVATAFSAAVGVYSIRSVFPEFFSSLRSRLHWRELLRYSLSLSAIAILYQLFWRAPSLLLGHLASVSEVGLFSAAATLASPPGFISLIFAQPFMPMMVDLYEQRNFRELDALYRTVTRWTSMVVLPGFGFLVLFRKPILTLFGQDFRGARNILIMLGLAWMVYYAKGPVAALLDMTGRQMIDLANLAGVLVLSLVLGLWWIPRAGALGAGWAISISILAWSLAELVEAWVLFRIPPFSKHLVQSAFPAVVAFGAGFLLQDHVSMAVQAVSVGGLYLSLSTLFGLTPADRELLQRGIKKVTLLISRPAVAPAQD